MTTAAITDDAVGLQHPFSAEVAQIVEELRPELRRLADELYDDPETAFAEHRSVARIAALLTDHAADIEIGAFGMPTAFRAVAGHDGPRVAILAEYDALPDIGHACGHNLIAASSVGAFLTVRRLLHRTGGTVELIGSPAEEGGGGKQIISEAGGFDGIAAALMVHPGNRTRIHSVGLGMRHVEVSYRGVEAHASAVPHLGYNALDAVVTAYQSIAQVRQHILPTDRVHGIITDGGRAPNIVPGRASAQFYVRSATVEGLTRLADRIDSALRGAAVSTGTEVSIVWDRSPAYLPMKVNGSLADRFVRNLRGRRDFPPAGMQPIAGGSTDMGNVSHVVPSIHPNIASSPVEIGGHSAAFAATTLLPQATEAIVDSVIGLATTVLDVFSDGDLRTAIAEEFAASSAVEARGGAR